MSIYVRHMNIVPIHGQRLGHIEGKTSVLYGSKEIFPNKRYIIINEERHLSSLPHAILTAGGGGGVELKRDARAAPPHSGSARPLSLSLQQPGMTGARVSYQHRRASLPRLVQHVLLQMRSRKPPTLPGRARAIDCCCYDNNAVVNWVHMTG